MKALVRSPPQHSLAINQLNALVRLPPVLKGKSSEAAFYEIHKELEIFKQQRKKHVKYSKRFMEAECEKTNRIREVPGSTQKTVMTDCM